jgi:hypothetical protein
LEKIEVHIGGSKSFVTTKDAVPTCATLYSEVTKQIDVSFHYAMEAMAMGLADILYVESARNVADVMTKPLYKPVFIGQRDSLGLRRCT